MKTFYQVDEKSIINLDFCAEISKEGITRLRFGMFNQQCLYKEFYCDDERDMEFTKLTKILTKELI